MIADNTITLKTIQLDSIRESATNPRRTFNQAKLQELADSIKAKGVLQPLIVRPVDDLTPYEIVAGARRYRAANLAKLEEVPCIVRNLDDKSVLEFQMIENSQRDDVGPIEESDGYARLIDDFGHSVSSLAKRVGKSEHHIAARISLRNLSANARAALEAETIKIGHAELLARLTVDQQEFTLQYFDLDDGNNLEPIYETVSGLREWIEHRIYTSLVTAPFPLNQKNISIGVPTCLECPKNSASQGALFADTAQAWCTDKTCYSQKVDDWTAKQQAKLKDDAKTFVQISQSWKGDRKTQALPNSAYKEVGSGDENAVEALVVDGPEKGHTKYVVLNEEAGKFLEECAKPQPEKKPEKSWQEQQQEDAEKRKKLGQLRSKMRLMAIRAIFEHEDGKPSPDKLRILFKPNFYAEESRALFIEVMGLEENKFKKGIPASYFENIDNTDQLLKAFIAAELCSSLRSGGYEPTDLSGEMERFASLYEIDVKQIKKQAQAELKEEEKAAAAAAAAKKAPAKKAKTKK